MRGGIAVHLSIGTAARSRVTARERSPPVWHRQARLTARPAALPVPTDVLPALVTHRAQDPPDARPCSPAWIDCDNADPGDLHHDGPGYQRQSSRTLRA